MKKSIEIIEKIKKGKQFKKYIDFIQFPFYRNLELDQRINFEFPLTVFIGQNGCGKSSCLHALYGAPLNKTPYDFWFDTKVDPISYYNDQRKRHSFWYSFEDDNGNLKEVIKARIKRGDDPNYWETSRPLKWAGMQTRKYKNDRDKPIGKNVIYMDFRSELSAFDKFFYFGDVKKLRSSNKQEFIRRKSISMKKIFDGEVVEIGKRNGIVNNQLVNLIDAQLKWISHILGRKYNSAKYLEHTFFRNFGYSVLFSTDYADYSEAFAGSGEVAIVRLVTKILEAPEFSLILLDEPEVSLHPGAQERLKEFLFDQIIKKKHQIIISTHSPIIAKNLPSSAIKAFYKNLSNNRFSIKENLTHDEAFYHIELPIENKKNIFVEDKLAKLIIKSVLDIMGEETKNLFNVQFHPGGATTLQKDFSTVFCREDNSMNFIIYDGDIKPIDNHYDWKDFAVRDMTVSFLRRKVKDQTGQDINFSVDGHEGQGNPVQKIDLYKRYLDYYKNCVFYLPKDIPEEIIWNQDKALIHIGAMVDDDEDIEKIKSEINSIDFKEKFAKLSTILFEINDADHIEKVHKMFIVNWIKEKDDSFEFIKKIIEKIRDA